MKRKLKFVRFYPHPPARVWKALTDQHALADWFMDNDFKPIVGHQFQFRTDPAPNFDGILNCEVIMVDEPYQLAYTFQGGYMRHQTVVTWTLMPKEDGTQLTLEHEGFTGLTDTFVSVILGYGWWRAFKDLPATLDGLARADAAHIPDTNA